MARNSYNAIAASNGRATIQIRSTAPQTWIIGQIQLTMPSAPAGCVCNIRYNNESAGIPAAAARDTVSGEPFIELLPRDVLSVEWTGATPGSSASITILYEVAR